MAADDKPRPELGAGLCYAALVLIGVTAAIGSFQYPILVSGNRVGPGLLPMVFGILLTICGVALLISSVRASASTAAGGNAGVNQGSAPSDDDTDASGKTAKQRVRHLWVVFGLLLVAIVLVYPLGFLTAFGLFVLAVSAGVERQPIVKSLLSAIAAVVVTYLLFVAFLSVPLPAGPFGF